MKVFPRFLRNRPKLLAGASFLVAVAITIAVTLVVLNWRSPQKNVEHAVEHLYTVRDPQFAHIMSTMIGPGLLDGNRVTPLQNGNEIFPAMLSAIRSAEESITFETFVYWDGDIGREFAEAMMERARAGVPVYIILDWWGTAEINEDYLDMMKEAGVEVGSFRPPRWYNLARLNNRTHRKLLVVDGRVGFTGGVGIADKWRGDARTPDEWREFQVQIEGPAVAQLQAAFMDNWLKINGEVMHGPEFFPPLDMVGETLAHVFKSSPDEGSQSARLMHLLAITAARERVRIGTAYFSPDDLMIEALIAAAQRGVQVQMIVPGPHMNKQFVRDVSRSLYGRLLEGGVEVYEYQPTMYHSKIMIVDDFFTTTGSANFDNRSFRLNEEANVNILCPEFAGKQSRVFDQDLEHSERITLDQWQNRSWRLWARERVMLPFRSQF